MQSQNLQGAQELLCINAEKVYDWVILQNTVNQTVAAGALGLPPGFNPCDPTVTNLTTRCFLVDENGDPLPVNAEVPVEEIGEREDRTFVIDGALVTLQRVTFVKPLCIRVEISGVAGTSPFVGLSDPISIDVPESIFLCAPEGTRLVVRLTDVECNVRVNCTGTEFDSIDIALSLCQSIQTVADVTLEIEADFCEPRDILVEQCPAPVIPPQCPVLFPGLAGE